MDKALLFFLLLLTACSSPPEPTLIDGTAMDMRYTIKIGREITNNEEVEIESLILATFQEINNRYNNWNPDSEISRLNALPAYTKVALSPELCAFLEKTAHLVTLTEGRFDPTVAPLAHLWKTYLNKGQIPPSEQLSKIIPAVGWDKIHLEDCYFWKEHELTAIDLGGIAKGYAVDLLTMRLAAAGYTDCYVEWSGEIRTLGSHPAKRPWTIAIHGGEIVPLVNQAIASSGSYIQNWIVDGVEYTHIIDPLTYKPLMNSPIEGTTVIAESCMEADALATALMLFPSKEAADSWAESKHITYFSWRDPSHASDHVQ